MKTLLRGFVCALALFSLAGVTVAAPHDDDHSHKRRVVYVDNGRYYADQHWNRDQAWQRQQREELRRRAEWQHQRDSEWQYRQEAELRRRADAQRYNDWRYARSNRNHWQRGHRYHGPTYVVRDYRHYHLRTPPRGQHWVRADDRYLLVAIATGIIMDIATR